ncbi:MAG: BA14K family protein [Pseudomonadota bacterium]
MYMRPLVKPILGAAALAALAVGFTPTAASAGPASCAAYARDVAAAEAPRRGIIDGVVIGTLDTVITGGAGADERYRDAYDEAYSNCMRSERTAYVVPRTEERIVVTARPEVGTDEWVAYCSAKYRSFDPETGTFVTYSGETLPCR